MPLSTTASSKHWCQHPKILCFIMLALCAPVGLMILAWGDEAVLVLGGGAPHLHVVYMVGFAAICLGIASPLALLPGKMGGHALGIGMLLLMLSSRPILGDLAEVAANKIQKAASLESAASQRFSR